MNHFKKYLIALIILLVTMLGVYQCQCTPNHETSSPRFMVYGSMNCGYTVKMLNYLKNANQSVQFIDVSTESGDLEFKRVTKDKNIRGVPYTIDNKTKKNIRGFQEIIL